jgi:hypothetical protein
MLSILLLAIALAQSPRPLIPLDSDAYDVFAAVLPSEWPVRVGRAKRLLIQDTTTVDRLTPDGAECYPEGLEGSWLEALADFKKQNATSQLLSPSFPIGLPYDLESKDVLLSFFKERGPIGWDDFNRVHRDTSGYVVVSAVGFDAAKTRAMVYVAEYCGGLCGAGSYHFLERKLAAWVETRLQAKTCRWIS